MADLYETLFECVKCEDKILSLDNYILHLQLFHKFSETRPPAAAATVYTTRGPALDMKELSDDTAIDLYKDIRGSIRIKDTMPWYPEKEDVGFTRIGETRYYRCDDCPFESGFIQHMRTHTKCHNRDCILHECEHCRIKFSQQANLQRHITRHVNPPLHTCPCCSKRFYRKDQKNEHIITHMDQFPITLNCPVDKCNKLVGSRRALKDHIQAHIIKDFLVCHHCRKIYANPIDFYRHAIKIFGAMFGEAIEADPQIDVVQLVLKSKREEAAERRMKKEGEKKIVKPEPMFYLDGLQFLYDLAAGPNQTSLEFLSEVCRYAFMPMLADTQSTSCSNIPSPTNP